MDVVEPRRARLARQAQAPLRGERRAPAGPPDGVAHERRVHEEALLAPVRVAAARRRVQRHDVRRRSRRRPREVRVEPAGEGAAPLQGQVEGEGRVGDALGLVQRNRVQIEGRHADGLALHDVLGQLVPLGLAQAVVARLLLVGPPQHPHVDVVLAHHLVLEGVPLR